MKGSHQWSIGDNRLMNELGEEFISIRESKEFDSIGAEGGEESQQVTQDDEVKTQAKQQYDRVEQGSTDLATRMV